MRLTVTAMLVALAACAVPAPTEPFHLIPGAVPLDRQPDGNSIILDAREGLIVVDTGRHAEHTHAILDYARERQRPVAAIVNTHWHYDHTTGNRAILNAFPGAEVVASGAIDGALYRDFATRSRRSAEEFLASGKATEQQKAEIERGFEAMDDRAALRAKRPVMSSGARKIAGRRLDVHLAGHAATEGDVWIYDPASRTVIAGDLVVDILPFMDTACPDGWAAALRQIAAVPFTTLIPGHGAPMSRDEFGQWVSAFDNFVACARSDAQPSACADRWRADAGRFIDTSHQEYAGKAAEYYVTTRFRTPGEEHRYCGD